MNFISHSVSAILKAIFLPRSILVAENILLRQQLGILKRSTKKATFRNWDRVFFTLITKLCCNYNWKNALLIIKPDTVIRWHRKGFRLYWKWKSRRGKKAGRKTIPYELKKMVGQMTTENPIWGAPRIRAELKLLGYTIALSTVAKYMRRNKKPPSQTWRTFLKNHAYQIAGIDFFNAVTVDFKILYCLIVLEHGSRKILHFNVTTNPGQVWTNLQVKQAFPFDSAPKYVVHDRATVFGPAFDKCLKTLGIKSVRTGFRAPWQNAYTERVIGTIKRECLDHVILFNEKHLRKIMKEFVDYYNNSRTHLSLNGNSPNPRITQPPEVGEVRSIEFLGGLHHRYYRKAA
ncbi:MAG: integrase core domain-containing protein [Chitinispirillales bacterium]|nr:integrase core domain-containing protein [Chitinispirillales bacterium]